MRVLVTGSLVCAVLAGGIWIGHSAGSAATVAAPMTSTVQVAAQTDPPADAESSTDAQAAMEAANAAEYIAHDAYDSGDPRATMPTKFSKASFSDFAFMKTKDDIRATLGKPDSVVELSNVVEWQYGSLPVYDEDAGIKVAAVGVMFSRQSGQVVHADFY
jgi:hypothetical protein